MMADLNSFTCIGRLTQDPQLKTIGSKGTSLLEMDIANNTGYGEYACTQFFRVQMWGKRGEGIFNYLHKGKQVGVTGVLENKKYTTQDGVQRDKWTITAQDIMFLQDPKGSTYPGGGSDSSEEYNF